MTTQITGITPGWKANMAMLMLLLLRFQLRFQLQLQLQPSAKTCTRSCSVSVRSSCAYRTPMLQRQIQLQLPFSHNPRPLGRLEASPPGAMPMPFGLPVGWPSLRMFLEIQNPSPR